MNRPFANYSNGHNRAAHIPQETQQSNEWDALSQHYQATQATGQVQYANPREFQNELGTKPNQDPTYWGQLPNAPAPSYPRNALHPLFQADVQSSFPQGNQMTSTDLPSQGQAEYGQPKFTTQQPHPSGATHLQVPGATAQHFPNIPLASHGGGLMYFASNAYMESAPTSSASLTSLSAYTSPLDGESRTSFGPSANSSNYRGTNPNAPYESHQGQRASMLSASAPDPRVSHEGSQAFNIKMRPPIQTTEIHNNSNEPLNRGERHRRDLSQNRDSGPGHRSSRRLSGSSSVNRRRHRGETRYQPSRRPIDIPRHGQDLKNSVDSACDTYVDRKLKEGNGIFNFTDVDIEIIAKFSGTDEREYIRNYVEHRVAGQGGDSQHSFISMASTEPTNTVYSEDGSAHLSREAIAWDHLEQCKGKNCDDCRGKNHAETSASANALHAKWDPDRPLQCLRIHDGVLCSRRFKTKDSWLSHLKITEPQIVIVCSVNGCGKPLTTHFFEHYRSHVHQGHISEDEIPHYRDKDIVISKPHFTGQCRFCWRIFNDWDKFHNDVFFHLTNHQATMIQWHFQYDPSDTEDSDVDRQDPNQGPPPNARGRGDDPDRDDDDDNDDEDDGNDYYDSKGKGRCRGHNQQPANSPGGERVKGAGESQHRNWEPESYGRTQFYNCRAHTWSAGCSQENRCRSRSSGRQFIRSSSARRSLSLDSVDRLALTNSYLMQTGSWVVTTDVPNGTKPLDTIQGSDPPPDADSPASPETVSDSGYGSGVEAHFETCQKAAERGRASSGAIFKSTAPSKTSFSCPFLSQIITHCISGPWGKRPAGPRAFIVVAGEFLLAPPAEDMAKRKRIWVMWSSIWEDVKWPKAYGDFVFLAPAEHRKLQKHEVMTRWYKNAIPQL